MRSELRILRRRWWRAGGLALAALVAGSPGYAQAITLDGTSAVAASAASTIVFSHDVGTARDRYLLVALSASSKVNAIAVELDGRPLTRLGTRATADPQWICTVELWGLVEPASGPGGVVVTFPSGVSLVAGAATFAGVDPRDPVGPFAAHDAWGSTVSMPSMAAAGELVVDAVCAYKFPRAPTATPGAGQTAVYDRASGELVLAASQRGGGAGLMQRWTLDQGNSANWAIAAVALRPAPVVLPGTGGAGANPGTGGAGGSATGGAGGAGGGGAPVGFDATPADRAIDLAGAGEVAPAEMPPGALPFDHADGPPAAPASASVAYRVSCACRLGGHRPGAGLFTPIALALGALAALAARRRR